MSDQTIWEVLDEYRKLRPTRREWQPDPQDPLYIWDGKSKDYPLCIMTLSAEDSQFICFAYKHMRLLVETIEKAATIVKSYKGTDERLAQERDANKKLWAEVEQAKKIIRKLIETEDLFAQQEARLEAVTFVQQKSS